jgi:hypothetical protein
MILSILSGNMLVVKSLLKRKQSKKQMKTVRFIRCNLLLSFVQYGLSKMEHAHTKEYYLKWSADL